MSYRGGHSGAVAVSFSTSTMSPLSPTRRYSGSTGSGTSVTSGANGTAASKYSSYRSSTPSSLANERNGGYYSSTSSAGYRSSGYSALASSETFRRAYYSPTRSVSSYNESGSIVGASSISGSAARYGSTSTSSASSTGSSSSSYTSRERNAYNHTPGSLATSAADLYAIYSPSNYVPNIHGSSAKGASSLGNRRQLSLSSGASSSLSSSELHGGDEYDSCRERRERSYSSEATSGVSRDSSVTSNNQNSRHSGCCNDRWTTRREIGKRRATPTIVNSGGDSPSGNANRKDVGSSTIEVTSESPDYPRESSVCRGNARCVVDDDISSLDDEVLLPDSTENRRRVALNGDYRDLDNNNAERETNVAAESETRRRRHGRRSLDVAETNLATRDEERDETRDGKQLTSAARKNRDNSDDSKVRDESKSSDDTRYDNRHHHHHHHHHHQRKRNVERGILNDDDANYRKDDRNIPNLSFNEASLSSLALSSSESRNENHPVNPAAPSSSSSSFLARGSVPETREAILKVNRTTRSSARSRDKSDNFENVTEDRDVLVDADGDDGHVGAAGVGGAVVAAAGGSADADNHRKALTRTEIITNGINTELLTNNNVQDREDRLGVAADKTFNGSTRVDVGRRRMIKGVGKTLLWTATNETDDDDDSARCGTLTNCDKTEDTANGFEKTNNHDVDDDDDDDNDGNLGVWDVNRDGTTAVTSSIAKNGSKPPGSRGDEVETVSISGRTLFGWNDPTIDDPAGASSSSASSTVDSSAATSSNSSSIPVGVHQSLYRGINDQIDETANSRAPRSRLSSRRDERYGLNGLRNIGNTCFMNSVIQCLSNTRPLLEYLLNEQHLQDINTTTSSMKGALIKAFGQVIQELWEVSGDHVVNTSSLKSQIQRFAPRFMGYSQQDAQEFLRYLLEGLHEDVNRVTVKPQPILTDIPDHYSDSHKASESWKRYLRSEDSMIVDFFVGQLRSSLLCTACDHVSVTLDPFWDLSLPIPLRLGTVKLNQCLEHFTKVETLDGDEKPTCSKCQMRRKCTKSFSIQKFPKILVIHLKRFSPTERFRGKLSVLVDFPLTCLDLSAFAAPGVQGCTYNLYGVANHSGTTYSGHYTAYCKHPYSGEWHEYNDSRVSTVPARSVVSSEAYVLFYEQQSPSPHL